MARKSKKSKDFCFSSSTVSLCDHINVRRHVINPLLMEITIVVRALRNEVVVERDLSYADQATRNQSGAAKIIAHF